MTDPAQNDQEPTPDAPDAQPEPTGEGVQHVAEGAEGATPDELAELSEAGVGNAADGDVAGSTAEVAPGDGEDAARGTAQGRE